MTRLESFFCKRKVRDGEKERKGILRNGDDIVGKEKHTVIHMLFMLNRIEMKKIIPKNTYYRGTHIHNYLEQLSIYEKNTIKIFIGKNYYFFSYFPSHSVY